MELQESKRPCPRVIIVMEWSEVQCSKSGQDNEREEQVIITKLKPQELMLRYIKILAMYRFA
jgi:hypothetical protein